MSLTITELITVGYKLGFLHIVVLSIELLQWQKKFFFLVSYVILFGILLTCAYLYLVMFSLCRFKIFVFGVMVF